MQPDGATSDASAHWKRALTRHYELDAPRLQPRATEVPALQAHAEDRALLSETPSEVSGLLRAAWPGTSGSSSRAPIAPSAECATVGDSPRAPFGHAALTFLRLAGAITHWPPSPTGFAEDREPW